MNTLLVISGINAGLRALQEMMALLATAASENRDVTDAEVNALRDGNDVVSTALIQRLGKPRDETSPG